MMEWSRSPKVVQYFIKGYLNLVGMSYCNHGKSAATTKMITRILALALVLGLTTIVEGDRTSSKIYESISGALACFRRLNATHQIGCSSKSQGDVGVLYLVNSAESLEWVTKTGPHEPYIAILYADQFNRGNLIAFQRSGRVSGVLLLRNKTEDMSSIGFSNDQTCPNQGFGLYTKPEDPNTCSNWNPTGSGLMFENWNFPIFLISDDEGKKVVKCYEEHNAPKNGSVSDWPLCAAQLKAFMMAAVNSVTCIRRSNVFSLTPTRMCDPLIDLNIWGSLNPRNQTQPYSNSSTGSVIVIAARQDASSMFDMISPGADSAATGIAAFFATVKHLASIRDQLLNSSIENVYFMLFNGESFDYVGSSRIVYDMKKNQFPFSIENGAPSQPALLKLENIKYFIEFNQVAASGNEPYFIHENSGGQFTSRLIKDGVDLKLNLSLPTAGTPIPPSSFQTFLAQRKDLPGVVITNYDKTFRNKFYNSMYDDVLALKYDPNAIKDSQSIQGKIATLAAAVARSIASIGQVDDAFIQSIEPDLTFSNDFLGCLVDNANCTLFQEIAGHTSIQSTPYPFYIGFMKNPLQTFLRKLLITVQGRNSSRNADECERDEEDQSVEYYWINGTCYQTTVNVSTAMSPAFQMDLQIAEEEWNSGLYSTWTESRWGPEMNVRIFLKPSLAHELLTLGFGTGVLIVSFIIVGLMTKKADVIFPTSSTEQVGS